MSPLRPWWHALAAGSLMGALPALVGQLLPPFHVPTHEFSQAFTLMAGGFCYAYGIVWARHLRACRPGLARLGLLRGAMARVLLAMLAMGLAAWIVLLAANELRCGCQLQEGAAFFWISWTPLALLGAVAGVALGERGWSRRRLLLVVFAVLAVTLVHDGLQALLGFRTVDLLIGQPLAFDQRAEVGLIRPVHLYQRALVAGVAFSAWCFATWRVVSGQARQDPGLEDEARARAFPALLSAGVLTVLVLVFGSHLGVGWGRSALHGHLSEQLHTEHFVLRYPVGGYAALYAPSVAREAEYHWQRYEQDWGIEPEKKITLYLFEDSQDMANWTDTSAPHAILRRIYASYWSARGDTLYHELAHALHVELRPSPLVLLSRGLLEGLAMAFEEDYARLPAAHRELAGALRAGELPAAADLVHPVGFFSVNESNAYDAAGSFLGWLVLEHGFERFVQLQQHPLLDFEAVYGQDLEQLDAGWRAFLAQVPVDMEELVEARDAYDPDLWPGYLDRCCPKLTQREPPLVELAEKLWRAEDWLAAAEIYDQLWQEEQQPRQAYQGAQCQRQLGQPGQGLALLDRALEVEELEDTERFRIQRGRVALLMELRQWEALEAALAARDALDEDPSVDRRRIAEALRDPALRDRVADALVTRDACNRRIILSELMEAQPERAALRYLYTTRVYSDIASPWGLGVRARERERAAEALEHAASAREAADRLAEELLVLVDKAIRAQDLALAESVSGQALELASDPLVRLQLQRRLERVAWERAGGS